MPSENIHSTEALLRSFGVWRNLICQRICFWQNRASTNSLVKTKNVLNIYINVLIELLTNDVLSIIWAGIYWNQGNYSNRLNKQNSM